jgi:hypothetical protein
MLQQVNTKTITEPGKTVKNVRNKDSWKIRIQRQTNGENNCPYLLKQEQVLIILN